LFSAPFGLPFPAAGGFRLVSDTILLPELLQQISFIPQDGRDFLGVADCCHQVHRAFKKRHGLTKQILIGDAGSHCVEMVALGSRHGCLLKWKERPHVTVTALSQT